MKRSRFTEEQIVYALKLAESGTAVANVCRKYGISDATFYTWRKKYGGLVVRRRRGKHKPARTGRARLPDDVEGDVAVAAPDAVGIEIAVVKGKDFLQRVRFRSRNQRSICEIHRRISVLHHQLKCPHQRVLVKKDHLQAPFGDEIHQGSGIVPGRPQQVEYLGEDRQGCGNRLVNVLENVDTAPMRAVAAVEQRHQWSGIGENH